MALLLSTAVFIWLLGFADKRTALKQNNYKIYLIITGAVVTLIMGLRTKYTGSTDTWVYMNYFEDMQSHPNFFEYYDTKLSESQFLLSETGFHLFVWLLSRVTSEPQALVFVTSAFITFSVCRFIHKNSEDPPTALLVYVCLGLFTFNMSGMRQAMAMSVCLFAYELAKKRKLIPFLLVVLLAMQMHKTAMCFVVIYILPVIKEGKANIFWYLVIMLVFLFSMDWIIETFNAFTGEDYEVGDEATGGGITVIMIYVASILLGMIMIDSLKKREIRTPYLIVVGGFITYISRYFANQIMERLSYYFFYFTILLIPNLINELDEQEKKVVKILFGIFAIVLFWYRIRSGAFSNFRLFYYYS